MATAVKKTTATNKAAPKPAGKNQVATTRTTGKAVAESNVDAMLLMRQDAGKGVSTSSEDNIIPLIYILQAQSPQALRQKTEYIKGAVAGNIWPRGSQTLIDGEEGMPVIPCGMRKWWMEWGPERGDGLKGRHEYDETADDKGRPSDAEQVEDPKTGNKIWVRENNNILVETREHAILAFIEGQWVPSVVAMSGSNHTCSRGWNGDMLRKRFEPPNDDFTPPAYAFVYNLKTVAKTNDKGDWYGWAFENGNGNGGEKTPVTALDNGIELYRMARSLHDAFMAGTKRAEDPTAPDSGTSNTNDDGDL